MKKIAIFVLMTLLTLNVFAQPYNPTPTTKSVMTDNAGNLVGASTNLFKDNIAKLTNDLGQAGFSAVSPAQIKQTAYTNITSLAQEWAIYYGTTVFPGMQLNEGGYIQPVKYLIGKTNNIVVTTNLGALGLGSLMGDPYNGIVPNNTKYNYQGNYIWTNDATFAAYDGQGGYYVCTNAGRIGKMYKWVGMGAWVLTTNIQTALDAADGTDVGYFANMTFGNDGLFGFWADWNTYENEIFVTWGEYTTNEMYTLTYDGTGLQTVNLTIGTTNLGGYVNIYSNSSVTIANGVNIAGGFFLNMGKPITYNSPYGYGGTVGQGSLNYFLGTTYSNSSLAPISVVAYPTLFFTNAAGKAKIEVYVDRVKSGEYSVPTSTNTPNGTRQIGSLSFQVPAGKTYYFVDKSTLGNKADIASKDGNLAKLTYLDGVNPAATSFRSNDLGEHIFKQFMSRTNGNDYIYITGKATNTGSYTIGATIRMPANFFLRDVTNILAPALGRRSASSFDVAHAGVAITPYICSGAGHVGGAGANTSGTNIWLHPDGVTWYTNVSIGQAGVMNYSIIPSGAMYDTNGSYTITGLSSNQTAYWSWTRTYESTNDYGIRYNSSTTSNTNVLNNYLNYVGSVTLKGATNKPVTAYFGPLGDLSISVMRDTNLYVIKCLPNITTKFSGNGITNSPLCVVFRSTYARTNYTAYLENITPPGYGYDMGYPQGYIPPSQYSFNAGAPGNWRYGDYSGGDGGQNGDSGVPVMTVINNEAVLMFSMFYPSSGPSPGLMQDILNITITNLCNQYSKPVEGIRLYDLDQFYDY